jgi:hypothetical protein
MPDQPLQHQLRSQIRQDLQDSRVPLVATIDGSSALGTALMRHSSVGLTGNPVSCRIRATTRRESVPKDLSPRPLVPDSPAGEDAAHTQGL